MVTIMVLMIVHAAAATLGWAEARALTPWRATVEVLDMPGLGAATLATMLFVGIGAASMRSVRRRLSYETWHGIHLLTHLAIGRSRHPSGPRNGQYHRARSSPERVAGRIRPVTTLAVPHSHVVARCASLLAVRPGVRRFPTPHGQERRRRHAPAPNAPSGCPRAYGRSLRNHDGTTASATRCTADRRGRRHHPDAGPVRDDGHLRSAHAPLPRFGPRGPPIPWRTRTDRHRSWVPAHLPRRFFRRSGQCDHREQPHPPCARPQRQGYLSLRSTPTRPRHQRRIAGGWSTAKASP
ncbi:MAG: ferric reductase [Microbacteriaceae bacterium]|nr:ferric reductase [Microbacteriaceae bacterium]